MTYDLSRFIDAQERSYPAAEREVSEGRKTSHWMWYIYPQLVGLGRSDTALHYGIESLAEAKAYLDHPVLGPRLLHMMDLMLQHLDQPADMILGPGDALKLRSCATLFSHVADAPPVFAQVVEMFYDGTRCEVTEALLRKAPVA